jgi:signal transduction histidine kinase/ActR/RegA family two-component response regulator
MEKLLAATADLTKLREVATGDMRADIDRRIGAVRSAVRDQQALVEAFKSDNALLHNSLTYFNHLSGRLAAGGGRRGMDLHAEIGTLTAAMLRFVNAPLPDSGREVGASLDRLAGLPVEAGLEEDVRSLVSHGRLVLETLPAVDDLVSRVQSAPTIDRVRALQAVYFDAEARAEARADVFLKLLYAAALLLLAYVAYLFVRLRANARTLRERLEFESLIASISTQFINLPRDRIRADIDEALVRLVEHAHVDGARIIVSADGEPDLAGSFSYRRAAADAPEARFAEVAKLVLSWKPDGYERQGCICVSDVVSLPASPQKTFLQAMHVLSLLCIPMRVAGEYLGVLALDTVVAKRHWRHDDIALLRTAAEIFANAIARERSEAEREVLQARLNQSQRLEAIGTLAGGIAHEFNNILGAIRGYGEMLLAVLHKESRPRRYAQQIMKAGERAQDVVEQLLAFGRHRERRHRPIRVEPIVAEAIDLIRASFSSTLSVHARLEAGSASVMGDATELQQIVMNLCNNAAQAMGGRGILTLVLDIVDCAEAAKLSHSSLPAGCHVRLRVEDTGHGIDEATLERIFEPFFTTRPAGEGTGLGLSTVHGIVGEHAGAINVVSRPAEGTTFEVYLPRLATIAAREDRAADAPLEFGHGETILIVDDDEPIVRLGEEMLAALGYEPVGFHGSRAAWTAFEDEPNRFDMVLTDEAMPGMTGTELAGAIHEVRPDLPIVLLTGYDGSLQADQLQAAGIREVLKKPLLSRALADCLARQRPVRQGVSQSAATAPFQP